MENRNNGNQEQNKKLVQRVFKEVMNEGKFEVVDELVTDDFVIHSARPEEELKGPAQTKAFYKMMHEAFPDSKFTIEDQISEGDKVVTHFTFSATHKGDFKEIPATGNKVSFSGIDIDTIQNGKFVECWTKIDEFSLMQQLGVIPQK